MALGPDTATQGAQSAPLQPQPDLSRDSLSERIYAHLRLELMSGLHAPGARLSIRRIASDLNLSPTPVREAVFQLAREGALDLRPGHQPRVPELNIPVYRNIRDAWAPLEKLAGELACVHIAAAEIEALAEHHRAYQRSEAEERWRDALIANQSFHFTIYAATKNPVLVRMIESLWLLAGPFVNAQYPHIREAGSEVNPHLLIIDALERRSPAETGELLVQDLREGAERILRHLEATQAKGARRRSAVAATAD